MTRAAIELLIEQCWNQGQTTQETRQMVERRHGQDPGFDQVRRIFADLSHQFTSERTPA